MGETRIRELYNKWQTLGSEALRGELFQAIWERYHPRLQVYFSRSHSGFLETEDMVSEILLYVFESIGTYNSRYAFSTWIYRVARNRFIDRIRKKEIPKEEIREDFPEEGETPESLMIKGEEERLVRDAVARLSETDRELVFFHFYENMKLREISTITGIPVGTVKYRMSEIRKGMKRDLERSFV